MKQIKYNTACVIGNGGLGDMITCIGMVNYLATKYKCVIVSCMKENKKQADTFYKNKNITVYPIDDGVNCSMYDYCSIIIKYFNYDVYAFGNYGASSIDNNKYTKVMNDGMTKKIISCYPTSYYEDVEIPFEYASKYFNVEYPPEILQIYEELFSFNMPYIVFHSSGSNVLLDPFEYENIDTNKYIVIDVNYNRYNPTHKYYNIASKFINLPSVLYYTKLLENAHDIYLIDSCIFALSLVINISKVNMKVCYKRESRFNYNNPDFQYHLLAFPIDYDKNNIKLQIIN